ncbi:MAG: HAD family hydrolase [Desulfovibrio sp.]|nr:HAD family hydrolase [Desulfovibrio sp.]
MHALIFDLDGTLLDSLEDIANAGNAILSTHGYPVRSLSEYRQLVGNGFHNLIRNALPPDVSATMPEDALAALITEARSWYANNLYRNTKPYVGLPEALQALARAGHSLAVLSNKPHELTVPLIDHFFPEVPFAHVIGGRKDFPLKPDPTVLLNMLQDMRVAHNQAFYVGDSNVDVFTARNAGLRSIGVAWGFRGVEELRAAQADLIIDSPAQLITVVND